MIHADHERAHHGLRRLLCGAPRMIDADGLEFDGDTRMTGTGVVEPRTADRWPADRRCGGCRRSCSSRDTLPGRLPAQTPCVSFVEPGAELSECTAERRVPPLSPGDLEQLAAA